MNIAINVYLANEYLINTRWMWALIFLLGANSKVDLQFCSMHDNSWCLGIPWKLKAC